MHNTGFEVLYSLPVCPAGGDGTHRVRRLNVHGFKQPVQSAELTEQGVSRRKKINAITGNQSRYIKMHIKTFLQQSLYIRNWQVYGAKEMAL